MTCIHQDELQTILHLSARSRSFLRRIGYTTVAQLLELGKEGLRSELGPVDWATLFEVEERLADLYEQVPGLPRFASIAVLDLSGIAASALAQNKLRSVYQLARLSAEQIGDLPGVGEKSAREIRSKLDAHLSEHPLPVISLPSSLPPPTLADAALLARAEEQGISLDAIPVERLGLNRWWLVELRKGGFRTVGDLARQHKDAWKAMPRIQWTVNRYLGWLVEQTEATWANEIAAKGLSFLHRLRLERSTLAALAKESLWFLDERQRQVIRWRYGLDGEALRFREIGERLEVSTQRVQQMHKQALEALKAVQPDDPLAALRAWLACTLEEAGGALSKEKVLDKLRQDVYVGQVDPAGVVRLLFAVAEVGRA
jgi:hypothetical protein